MAKYRVTATSFIGNTIVREDEVVEYDGTPGDNLEPIDPPAKSKKKSAATAEADSAERQAEAVAGRDPNAAEGAAGMV